MTLAVLGAGSWGTALAVVLARNGHAVRLWGHDPAHLAPLAQDRINAAYLPGIPFPDGLSVVTEPARALAGAAGVLVVVPSHAFRATLERFKPHLSSDTLLACASKGFEPETRLRLSAVAHAVLGTRTFAVVSGPSFAPEVARGLPAALTVACDGAEAANTVVAWLRNDRLRLYTSADVAGVEVAGAVKNVIAIAAGISDGLGFGANARAALITRGLAEMTRLGLALGGALQTFMGLAGLGDLVLTATSDTSRNRRVGLAIARGEPLAEVLKRLGQVAEGVPTAREVLRLARPLGVELPITEQVCKVLFEGLAPATAVETLIKRSTRPESILPQ